MSLDVRIADLGPELHLEYVEAGDPDGVPVLLLHGNVDSWRAWEPLFLYLPVSLRTLAVSQRGHGGSSKPDDGYTPSGFAADAAAFLDAVGVESAFVVGHSSHGLASQRFALAYPERTLGIIPIAAPASLRDEPALRALVTELGSVSDPLDPDHVRDFVSGTFTRPLPDDFVDTIVAESRKVPARVWRALFAGLLDEDLSTDRARITAPTLLLWGDQDGIVGWHDQQTVASQIPGAELRIYEGVGHSPHWEAAELVASDIARFAVRHSRHGEAGRGEHARAPHLDR